MKRLFGFLLFALIASLAVAAPLTRLEPIQGNIVLRDDTQLARWYDAWGPTTAKLIEDFISAPVDDTTGDLSAWTTTVVEVGTGDTVHAITGEAGGVLLVTNAANEDDGLNLQLKGEAFKLVSGKPLYFGTRLKISDATQSDLLVGLCITDTTLLGGMTDGLYFRKADGSTAVSFVTEKNTSETSAAALTADTSYHTLEFYFNGTDVRYFVDGAEIGIITATIPDDEELTPSIHFLNGAAAVKTLNVDWIRCIQLN